MAFWFQFFADIFGYFLLVVFGFTGSLIFAGEVISVLFGFFVFTGSGIFGEGIITGVGEGLTIVTFVGWGLVSSIWSLAESWLSSTFLV